MIHLAIIIVSYNTCDLLRQSLRSVFRAQARRVEQMTLEIIVVDNASSDDSVAMLRNEFPQVTLIASEINLGFTKANNLALRELGWGDGEMGRQGDREIPHSAFRIPHSVLLLNPDTEIEDDALWQMAQWLESSPTAGACGATLRYGDGLFQHGAFHFPTLAQAALDLFPISGFRGLHRLYNSPLNGRYSAAQWQGDSPFAVDFVLGAALMVKAEVIRQVGLLDEGYFMYCEEIDWCLRIKKAGWQIFAVPTAKIIHHEAQSSKQVRWRSFVRLWQSRLRFYKKHADRYSAAERLALGWLVKVALHWRKRTARQRFAQGEIDGKVLAEELAAYAEVVLLF